MTPTALGAAAVLLALPLPLSMAADTNGDRHDTAPCNGEGIQLQRPDGATRVARVS